MGWFKRFSLDGPAADASDMAMFNDTPRHAGNRGVVTMSATPEAPDPPLSEEIKRRQVALILRYVTAVRAR